MNDKSCILAIDTHSASCSIGIVINSEIVGLMYLKSSISHTKKLFNCLEYLFTQFNITMDNIENLAINIGPGSFTGIRIGISAIKGLAINRKITIYSFDTNTILAESVDIADGYISTLVDAGRGEVYFRLYEKYNKKVKAITQHYLLKPLELFNFIDKGKIEETYLIGSGANKYKEKLNLLGFKKILNDAGIIFSKVMLDIIMAGYNEIVSLDNLNPLYIRKSDAEIKKN